MNKSFGIGHHEIELGNKHRAKIKRHATNDKHSESELLLQKALPFMVAMCFTAFEEEV